MFILQQGHGMFSSMDEFFTDHNNSGVILSPRAAEREQLERYLPSIKRHPGTLVLFDPNFYEPRTDHNKILTYPYFENFNFQTATFNNNDLCRGVIDYQINVLELEKIILPGRYCNSLNESWQGMQRTFADIGREYREEYEVYSTLSLGPDLILNSDHFNSILDETINYPVDGVYIIYEHQVRQEMLNEEFLYVMLSAILSLSLSGKKIILGYGNQQSSIFYAAGADYLASGNYRNVRSFDHTNLMEQDSERRKSVWYFDGYSFGEYKIPTLSLAFRRGLRDNFGPITNYNMQLLSAANPTLAGWREPDSFRNYFDQLYQLCNMLSGLPKNARALRLVRVFSDIQTTIERLTSRGFNFGERGFNGVINATQAALSAFITDRGTDIQNL